MTELLLVVAVLTGAAGIGLIVTARAAAQARVGVVRAGGRPDVAPIAAGVVVCALLVALTGWMLPALVVAASVAWAVRATRGRARSDRHGVERVEALAAWVENVRDVLRAGHQPIGAVGATVESCPSVIRPSVRTMHARLSAGAAVEPTLRRFADDLDDPLADLVAVGLLVAITRGAETEGVLTSLAHQTRHHAERRRIVEAERAPVQREVQMVSVVMCLLLGLVFAFGRSEYLEAYDTFAGQLVLAVVLVAYLALVAWVIRLTRFPRPSRFLTLEGVR
jgi:Flp pilus assembly protein TadB